MDADLGPDVGRRLRELRVARLLGQHEMAAITGIDQAVLSRWETGSQIPNQRSICRLAGLYGMAIDQLLPGGLYDRITDHWEIVRVQRSNGR